MWLKILIGAVAGLIVGHWVEPGYAVWVLIGIIVGALLDVLLQKRSQSTKEQQ